MPPKERFTGRFIGTLSGYYGGNPLWGRSLRFFSDLRRNSKGIMEEQIKQGAAATVDASQELGSPDFSR